MKYFVTVLVIQITEKQIISNDDVQTSSKIVVLSILDFVEGLLIDSHSQFDENFRRTYGVLYERNAVVFTDYFQVTMPELSDDPSVGLVIELYPDLYVDPKHHQIRSQITSNAHKSWLDSLIFSRFRVGYL